MNYNKIFLNLSNLVIVICVVLTSCSYKKSESEPSNSDTKDLESSFTASKLELVSENVTQLENDLPVEKTYQVKSCLRDKHTQYLLISIKVDVRVNNQPISLTSNENGCIFFPIKVNFDSTQNEELIHFNVEMNVPNRGRKEFGISLNPWQGQSLFDQRYEDAPKIFSNNNNTKPQLWANEGILRAYSTDYSIYSRLSLEVEKKYELSIPLFIQSKNSGNNYINAYDGKYSVEVVLMSLRDEEIISQSQNLLNVRNGNLSGFIRINYLFKDNPYMLSRMRLVLRIKSDHQSILPVTLSSSIIALRENQDLIFKVFSDQSVFEKIPPSLNREAIFEQAKMAKKFFLKSTNFHDLDNLLYGMLYGRRKTPRVSKEEFDLLTSKPSLENIRTLCNLYRNILVKIKCKRAKDYWKYIDYRSITFVDEIINPEKSQARIDVTEIQTSVRIIFEHRVNRVSEEGKENHRGTKVEGHVGLELKYGIFKSEAKWVGYDGKKTYTRKAIQNTGIEGRRIELKDNKYLQNIEIKYTFQAIGDQCIAFVLPQQNDTKYFVCNSQENQEVELTEYWHFVHQNISNFTQDMWNTSNQEIFATVIRGHENYYNFRTMFEEQSGDIIFSPLVEYPYVSHEFQKLIPNATIPFSDNTAPPAVFISRFAD